MTQELPSPSPVETSAAEGDSLPLYLQVASTLRTAIVRGVHPVGSRIPTEDELCRQFGVSRHTIREALRQLRADEMIISRPGSRPVVATPSLPKEPEFFPGEGGFDYMIGTRIEIASMEMVTISPELTDQVFLPTGEQWLSVKGYRRNTESKQITCWNEYFIHPQYATIGRLLHRHVGPIVPLLEDLFNKKIARITRSVSAVEAPAEHAASFALMKKAPALLILTRRETADKRIALVNRSFHPHGTINYSIQR